MEMDSAIQMRPIGDILAEHIPFLRLTWDGVIVQTNHALDVLLGLGPVQDAHLTSALAEHPALLSSIQTTLDDKIPYQSRLVHIERAQHSSSVLVDALAGGDSGWIFIFREVENIASLEGRMHDHGRLATLGKIAAGIAHEIRNPLTSISGFTQMLRENFVRDRMERELSYTDIIAVELARIGRLVDNLVLLSRAEPARLKRVNVDAFLQELEPQLRTYASARGVELCAGGETVPDILADDALLREVIMQLAWNAVQSMENGGELSISSGYAAEESLVWLHVTDTGPGIPNYMMDRIFDAFFTTRETGFGLGLPICQRIITDLGGQIRVLNKGFGTTFSVALPTCGEE